MGAGVRDAMNLAWKMAGVIAGDLPVDVLDTYEQERKPHTRQMIRLALGVGWAMTAGGRVRQPDPARGRPAHASHPWPARQDPRQSDAGPTPLGIRSATSHTASPGRDSVPQSRVFRGGGSTAPRRRLRASSPRPPGDAQRALLDTRGAAVHIAEPGSELADWLRRGRARAAIVRPDRTVMCASRDLRYLCEAVPSFMSGRSVQSDV